jgi:hypothetical protein
MCKVWRGREAKNPIEIRMDERQYIGEKPKVKKGRKEMGRDGGKSHWIWIADRRDFQFDEEE